MQHSTPRASHDVYVAASKVYYYQDRNEAIRQLRAYASEDSGLGSDERQRLRDRAGRWERAMCAADLDPSDFHTLAIECLLDCANYHTMRGEHDAAVAYLLAGVAQVHIGTASFHNWASALYGECMGSGLRTLAAAAAGLLVAHLEFVVHCGAQPMDERQMAALGGAVCDVGTLEPLELFLPPNCSDLVRTRLPATFADRLKNLGSLGEDPASA
jgi:hypothetical protein